MTPTTTGPDKIGPTTITTITSMSVTATPRLMKTAQARPGEGEGEALPMTSQDRLADPFRQQLKQPWGAEEKARPQAGRPEERHEPPTPAAHRTAHRPREALCPRQPKVQGRPRPRKGENPAGEEGGITLSRPGARTGAQVLLATRTTKK
eukprot:6593487-Alexandrium_andersonii.AAC.1